METTVTEVKKSRGAPKGRIMSDAQREGLKKGLEVLKARRDAKAKEKEEAKKKELPIPEPLPVINQPEVNKELVIPPALDIRPKKTRNREPTVRVSEFSKFKEDMIQNISSLKPISAPPPSPSQPQERVIEKVVEKQVYLTGSELLNKIFKFN